MKMTRGQGKYWPYDRGAESTKEGEAVKLNVEHSRNSSHPPKQYTANCADGRWSSGFIRLISEIHAQKIRDALPILAVAALCSSLLAVEPLPASAHPLVWDAMEKNHDAKPGDPTAEIAFEVTNRSAQAVVVDAVEPSCGCTVAEMPANPWRLEPFASGMLRLKVDLIGKSGEMSKSVVIRSAAGEQTLKIRINAPQMSAADRERNQQLAVADRQAVFRGECARCHAAPTVGKYAGELFRTACAICHSASHRAAMVPDLAQPKPGTRRDAVYWQAIIVEGRDQTLMPAFAKTHGGILDNDQIQSLVDYLVNAFATEASPVPADR